MLRCMCAAWGDPYLGKFVPEILDEVEEFIRRFVVT